MVGDEATESESRRTMLKGALASAVAAVGFTGAASAFDPPGRVELEQKRREFADDGVARDAFEAHGGDLLEELTARGYIESATVDALDTDDLHVAGFEAAGTPTAHVQTTMQADAGRLTVAVEPHAGRQYATLTGDDGVATVIDPDMDDDVTPQCIPGTACLAEAKLECGQYEICCGSGYCRVNSRVGSCSGTCYSGCGAVC